VTTDGRDQKDASLDVAQLLSAKELEARFGRELVLACALAGIAVAPDQPDNGAVSGLDLQGQFAKPQL
jgi:hypothetical protein